MKRLILALVVAAATTVLASDMTASMVEMWELGEASGGATGAHAGIALTDNNTVGAGTCGARAGRDFEFDNSEYLSAADSSTLSLGADTSFTVAYRIKFESAGGGTQRFMVSKDDEAGSDREWLLLWTDSVGFRFFVWDSTSSNTNVVDSQSISPGTCYTVVAWHDAAANQIGIKVNNGTAITSAHTTGTRDTAANLRIGANGSLANYMDGVIGSVVYWKRKISDAEMTEYYNAGAGVAYADIDAGGGGGGGSSRKRRLLMGVGDEQ